MLHNALIISGHNALLGTIGFKVLKHMRVFIDENKKKI